MAHSLFEFSCSKFAVTEIFQEEFGVNFRKGTTFTFSRLPY